MKLIIFSGLPGTGKSALAEAAARQLGIPVFAKDWLEATLLRCEMTPANPEKPLGSAGYQLLTTLAERQLMLGQSVILDSVASTASIRQTWRELAAKYHAEWYVIECICSDERLHRARLEPRQRNIPGWRELTWDEVERVKSYYVAWDEPHLIVDAIRPLEANLHKAIDYLQKSEKVGRL
jgi:predicted kinase